MGSGSADETSDHRIDVTNDGCSDAGGDSCAPDEEDDEEGRQHQCLQCDKTFADYDT